MAYGNFSESDNAKFGVNIGSITDTSFSSSIQYALGTAEILGMVFENLPPPSLIVAAHVCKRWYNAAQPFMCQHTVWKDKSNQLQCSGGDFRVLHRAPLVKHILSCHFDLPWQSSVDSEMGNTPATESHQAWHELLEQLSPPKREYSYGNRSVIMSNITRSTFAATIAEKILSPTSKARSTFSISGFALPKVRGRIRNLYMTGHIIPSVHVAKILSHVGTSLTKLDLRFYGEPVEELDLFDVLNSCRRLSFIHISNCRIKPFLSRHHQPLNGISECSFEIGEGDPSAENAAITDSNQSFQFSSALQCLSMLQTSIDTTSLGCILRCSSFLREFRLANIEGVHPSVIPVDVHLVLGTLGRFCPHLDTVQLPTVSQATPSYPLDKMVKELPRLERISLHDCEFTPIFYEPLLVRQAHGACRITTLELHKTPMNSSGSTSLTSFQDELLHQFLCTCPTLLRLYAYDIFFGIHYFGDAHETSPSDQSPGNEWACRDLRTLELSFKSLDLDIDFQDRHRMVLKYLSRVCPKLAHLHIYLFRVSLTPEDGIEYLQSLADLETLGLGTSVIRVPRKSDIEWMRKSSLATLKEVRWRKYGGWIHRKRITWGTDLSKFIKKRTKNQWLTKDLVANGSDNEDCGSRKVWPKMSSLRMYYESTSAETDIMAEQIRKVIQNVRPEIDFRVIKEPDVERPLW